MAEQGHEHPGHEPDKVYVVSDYNAALLYACVHGPQAWVYEVEMEGQPGIDLDFLGGDDSDIESMTCDRARIIRRLKPSNRDVSVMQRILHS